jgi:hypothetical protein
MNERYSHEVRSPAILGLTFTFVGACWLGGNFGVEPGRVLGPLWPWPLILFMIGFAVLLGRTPHSVPRGLALVLGGVLVWVSRESTVPVPHWNVLAPMLLILVGGVITGYSFFWQPRGYEGRGWIRTRTSTRETQE